MDLLLTISAEHGIGLAAALLLLGYLVFALVRAERF